MYRVKVSIVKNGLITTLISPKDASITSDGSSSSSQLSWFPLKLHGKDKEGSQAIFSRLLLLAKDDESRGWLVVELKEENSGKLLVRSLLSVLRRAEIVGGEQEGAESREDTVEERLES